MSKIASQTNNTMKPTPDLYHPADASREITDSRDLNSTTQLQSDQQQPRRSSMAKFKDFLHLHQDSSSQQSPTTTTRRPSAPNGSSSPPPQSQKKAMELTQRRLEAVSFYEQNLTERINDTLATDKERAAARSEKTLWDGKSQEQREAWVSNRMMLKEGWGGGLYPEGACGPGMWYR